jgi:hypothetical protein
MPEPLQHQNVDKKDDAVLAQEAQRHIAKSPTTQLVAELLTELRTRAFAWWTPERLRDIWGASDRMRWLADRADLRQQITTSLTGLVPKAARRKDAEFQAGLIDSAIDDGDVTLVAFEDAFDPSALAIYGPVREFWQQFRTRMPWEQDTPAHQELVAFLLTALLTDRGSLAGHTRKPILTPWDVRTAISGRVWHTRIPLEVRVAIDDARLERERDKGNDPFHAKDDLAIATCAIIAANVPLKELARLLDVAEKALGVAPPPAPVAPEALDPESTLSGDALVRAAEQAAREKAEANGKAGGAQAAAPAKPANAGADAGAAGAPGKSSPPPLPGAADGAPPKDAKDAKPESASATDAKGKAEPRADAKLDPKPEATPRSDAKPEAKAADPKAEPPKGDARPAETKPGDAKKLADAAAPAVPPAAAPAPGTAAPAAVAKGKEPAPPGPRASRPSFESWVNPKKLSALEEAAVAPEGEDVIIDDFGGADEDDRTSPGILPVKL